MKHSPFHAPWTVVYFFFTNSFVSLVSAQEGTVVPSSDGTDIEIDVNQSANIVGGQAATFGDILRSPFLILSDVGAS